MHFQTGGKAPEELQRKAMHMVLNSLLHKLSPYKPTVSLMIRLYDGIGCLIASYLFRFCERFATKFRRIPRFPRPCGSTTRRYRFLALLTVWILQQSCDDTWCLLAICAGSKTQSYEPCVRLPELKRMLAETITKCWRVGRFSKSRISK